MKIEKLTPEQEARLDIIKDEYIEHALTYVPLDLEAAKDCIGQAYSLIDLPLPEIVVCGSPLEMQKKANELAKTEKTFYAFGSYLTVGWQSFYAYYDVFKELGVITEENSPEYFKLRRFLDSGIFLTIEFDTHILICEKPVVCLRNNTRLHNTKGYAIEWRNGDGLYFINGRSIEKDVYEKALNRTLTKKEYINETNDETRSAWYEILGPEALMKLLDAGLVDTRKIVHKNGDVETFELYRTKKNDNKILNEPYAWLKRICPSTGTVYLTPTNPAFNDALESAKFHRPEFVPSSLEYSWFSRS